MTPVSLSRFFLLLSALLVLSACGGGGSSGNGPADSPSGSNSPPGGGEDSPDLGSGQGLVEPDGPLVDANVEVYRADHYDGLLLCTQQTSSASAEEGPGVLDLSHCPIDPDHVYYIVINDGMAVSAADENTGLTQQAFMDGELRAIISGQVILDGNFSINILSELFSGIIIDEILSQGRGSGFIEDRLDMLARAILQEDVNGDGVINNLDILFLLPEPESQEPVLSPELQELSDKMVVALFSGDRGAMVALSRQFLHGASEEVVWGQIPELQKVRVSSVLLEDDRLYVAGYENVNIIETSPEFVYLEIFDASQFPQLTHLSSIEISAREGASSLAMLKMQDTLVIGGAYKKLIEVDLSDIESPGVAERTIEGDAVALVEMSDTIYFAGEYLTNSEGGGFDPEARILTVDIADNVLSRLKPGPEHRFVHDLAYMDGALFMSSEGVSRFDVSDPHLPLMVERINSTVATGQLALIDGKLLAGSGNLIGMIDVSGPDSLVFEGNFGGFYPINEIAVHQGTIYVMSYTIIDGKVINMLVTMTLGDDGGFSNQYSRTAPAGRSDTISFGDQRAFLFSQNSAVSYPLNSFIPTDSYLTYQPTMGTSQQIFLADNNIAVVNDWYELLFVDISSPEAQLNILGSLDLGGQIQSLAVSGTTAYVFARPVGLSIVDFSDPSNPDILASHPSLFFTVDEGESPLYMGEIGIQGNMVYLRECPPSDSCELLALDFSDPEAPAVVGHTPLEHGVSEIVATPGALYLLDHDSQLMVYDIIEPSAISLFSGQNLIAETLAVSGDYLYASAAGGGVTVLNIASPTTPVLFGGTASYGEGTAIVEHNDMAYVANIMGFVEVFDLNDKTRPELTGVFYVNGYVHDVAANHEYVFFANGMGFGVLPIVQRE